MSYSSTPKGSNEECSRMPGEDDADNTIVQQSDSADIVATLMERLKVLEENNRRISQQLVQSETKRLQLQQVNDVATTAQNTIAATTNHSVENTNVCYNINQQPIASTTYVPTMVMGRSVNAQPYLTMTGADNVSVSAQWGTNTCPTYSTASTNGMYMGPSMCGVSCANTRGSCETQHLNVQLPTRKLHELPEFSGSPEQWPIFITAFTESSMAYKYTNLENTFRLQKCLKGSAREEVDCLLINPGNVVQIIEQLRFKYGRPELLIKSQLQKVRDIVAISENHLEKLVPFATKVQNLTTSLKNCNAAQHLSNPTLMEELIAKIPMSKRIEWASCSSAIQPYPTLEHFNNWISQMAKIIATVTPVVPTVLPHSTIKNSFGQSRGGTRQVFLVMEGNNMKDSCVKYISIKKAFVEPSYKIKTSKLSSNRQQLSGSENFSSRESPSFSDQHILYTPVFYIPGNGGYVAASSAGYKLPQQSGLQQPTVSAAAASASPVTSQPPIQILHGIQPTVTTGQQSDLYKMQPQSAQNIYVPQSAANNSTARTNQPAAGNIYRQNPSSPAPRNRYVHSTMYPTVHQGVVLSQFTAPYATRTPQLQQCQYSPPFFPQMYYPYFVQQPPQQQRAAVNTGVGVGLSNAMAVQPGGSVSGPTATANQGQIPLGVAPVASTVLGVANTTTAQPVGVAPLVGLPHQPPQQQPQNLTQTKGKPRLYALQIIHPITNRNILDDLDIDKNDSTNIISGSTTSSPCTTALNVDSSLDIEIGSSTSSTSTSIKSAMKLPEISNTNAEIVEPIIETSLHQTCGSTIHTIERNFKDATPQQTPIVSAMTDAPSVEIFPTQPQKQRTKKVQNISIMKEDQIICQGKTEENSKKVTDASTTALENSNCVQEPLPSSFINQQVPDTEQLKKQKKADISSKSQPSIQNTSDNIISKQNQAKPNCTDECTGASKENPTIYNITESLKTMQLEEKENLVLPQQKQSNIVNSNEQQQQTQDQEKQEPQYSNGNNIASVITSIAVTTKTFTESTDNVTNNNDLINNNKNNKKSNNVNKTTTKATKTSLTKSDKLDKKNDNIIEKTKTTSSAVVVGVEIEKEKEKDRSSAIEAPKFISSNSKPETKSKDEDRDETDKVNILPKNELEKLKKIENNTTKTLANEDYIAETTLIHQERAKSETEDNSEDIAKNNENNVEDTSTNTSSTTTENLTLKPPFESLINYNEGQWSPSNPNGKKQYNREQLLTLRIAKASRVQPDVKNPSIYSQYTLFPSFKKNQSMVSGFGEPRGSRDSNCQNNYTKQSSMSGRGGADNGHHNRNSGKPIIHLNLSLNQEVKLNEADNAWRPRVLGKRTDTQTDPEQKAQREKEDLIRRVRGILNKLTPENFEPLVEEIIKLKIDTLEKMEAVMILVFEKAIDEPNFSVSYASLCHRLITEVRARDERMDGGTKSNLALFRSALLDKTEREFTQNVTKSSAKEEKLKPIREKIINSKDPNEKVELEALLDEEKRKIRRRSGGTVRFIGELFKISILTGRITYTCIEALLKDPNNEDMLECLCKLLTTVGQKFEQTHISKEDTRKYSLEDVIQRMQQIASKSENSKISSRVRFMLQDVIDLRKKKWQSSRNEAPKTMEQIEKEANNEQLNNPYNYINSIPSGSGVSGKRDDRGSRNEGRNYGGSNSQRGDTGSLKRQQAGIVGGSHSQSGNTNNDDTWHVQTGKGNRSLLVDSSKLVGMAVDMNNKKMGGLALFQWNNASSQPTSTPSNSFAALSLDSNRSSERDRSGPRNKGSYNKGSMERDRYEHGLLPRTSSAQASRENSSSRGNQGVRGMSGNGSNIQKSSSHSKYQQPMSSSSLSRMTTSKMSGITSSSGAAGTSGSSLFRDSQQHPFYSSLNATHHQQPQQLHPAANELTQPSSAPPAVFDYPSESDLKTIKAVINEMMESAVNSQCIDSSTVSCIKKLEDKQLCGLLYYILTDYLHLRSVGSISRRQLANVVAYIIEKKYISIEHFRLAYKHFAKVANDLIVDIPELWLYIFEFTGPLIIKNLITVNDLWNSQLRESGDDNFSLKFLKTFLHYCTREVGLNFTRNMWKKNHMKWTNFMNEKEVAKFIQTNKFEYIENENIQPDINSNESKEKRNKRVVEHIEQLLKEGSNADNIIDYINGNIVDVDKSFIHSLTTILTKFAINGSKSALDSPCFQKICIPILLRYIDSKEEFELECLYAIQFLVHRLEHPRGLLGTIFGELNDADVIPQDTFIAWRDSKEQSAGKGVAVKYLHRFFNEVIDGETSDDN